MKISLPTMIIIAFLLSLIGCGRKSSHKEEKQVKQIPEWAKDAVIYEVNLRQHTAEGTFDAFIPDIPRLKQMGIDILWIMPVQEIGVLKRKGVKGSYYSIQDYQKINREFGTLGDFKKLVKVAHDNGMYVILDWVANHTSWDHVWLKKHPDFFTRDSLGNCVSPLEDWADVMDLNYENKEMRNAMLEEMKYWLIETDIDGFRCDAAEMVPTDFWDSVRLELDKIKPVFMLAEAESPEHHKTAFDMSYSWWLLHGMNQIARGEKPVTELDTILKWEAKNFAAGSVKMRFTTNHDENSWNGTEFERYGAGHLCFSVLCYTLPGMPLLYSGQEAAFDKRLKFFDKDTIVWGNYKYQEFYTSLNKLKKDNPVLWNGGYGGDFKIIYSSKKSPIFAFARKKDDDEIIAIFNFSNKNATASIKLKDKNATYHNYFNFVPYNSDSLKSINLYGWEYLVLIKTK